jgi:PAS domain S-box-containing protein
MAPVDVEQYRALVEHAPTMVWRAGIDAKHDYFNATWLAFTGRSLEQEVGLGWLQGMHPDDVNTHLAIHREHFERRQPFETEYRLRRFDGVYRYVLDRGVPYTDAAGAFAGFIGSGVDVDDRHTSHFFEMSLDNVCVAGLDGYFKRINPSWTKTLGWTAEELMSKPSIEFVHPEDRSATIAGHGRLQEGSTLRFDIVLSDLMMPEMSGMDFYDEVARRFPDVAGRVVFISGGAFTPRANAFLDRVGNERIEKPFDPRSVRAMVQRFVR